jgi:hypothetical protein
MNKFRNIHGLSGKVAVSCSGDGKNWVGGLAMLWKEGIDVEVISFSNNHIDVLISMEEGEEKWRRTGIYGFPEAPLKYKTFNLIDNLVEANDNSRWLLMGDFNVIISQDEREGGSEVRNNILYGFRETLQNHNLSDLGFEADKYTWQNKQEGESNIKAI